LTEPIDLDLTAIDANNSRYRTIFPAFFRRSV